MENIKLTPSLFSIMIKLVKKHILNIQGLIYISVSRGSLTSKWNKKLVKKLSKTFTENILKINDKSLARFYLEYCGIIHKQKDKLCFLWLQLISVIYKGNRQRRFIRKWGLNHSTKREMQKQPPEVFCKKRCFENFTKFTGKHLRQSRFV